jgi:hypothetical protein
LRFLNFNIHCNYIFNLGKDKNNLSIDGIFVLSYEYFVLLLWGIFWYFSCFFFKLMLKVIILVLMVFLYFQTTCVIPFDICSWASTVSIDVPSCSFLFGLVCDSLWWSDFDGYLISPFFSLSWYVMYIIVLFVFYFSILVPILLICYFIPFSFIEVFILFNLVI